MIEDPKTPGAAPEHPLQYIWTIFHDTKAKAPYASTKSMGDEGVPFTAVPESGDYEAGLTVIGEFDTVESFCRYFNWLKSPSKLERNSNYHIFKSGIKPMWEDAANAQGGKWVLTMKNNPALLDRCWAWLAMALVGEELEEGDEICGAVRLNGIGKKLVKLLDVSEADSIRLEFQYNTEDRPLQNKFLSIQAMPSTSYRSTFGPSANQPRKGSFGNIVSPTSEAGTPASTVSGGAFGSFGIGNIGDAGCVWERSGLECKKL
ncbi:translation initiation factor eIF 4e-like domain-containing protein [Boletus edulis BED1]|uniref:Translation initiation factor eIF 4e-like domain-containing protein n=1 Tax=Boletus edulis BED1 TaxID=1328754 RepID=A0AAD4BU77_BOLED|nr:translation initiation factor eIF 4e-like domain-containing protein [Boletus edulis BED1]